MTTTLPTGWARAALRDICLPVATIQPGQSPATEYTYFDIGAIDNHQHRITAAKTVMGLSAPSRARQAVRKGDILFSNVRTYLRNIALVEEDYLNPVASTGFTVIRPAKGIVPRFLFYQVLSNDFLSELHGLQTGTSYPAVRPSDVFSRSIALAPTREQEQIAAAVHEAFATFDRAESAGTAALNRLDRYCTLLIEAAVSGRLTSEWRKTRQGETTVSETGENLLKRLLLTRRKNWEDSNTPGDETVSNVGNRTRASRRYPVPVPPDKSELPKTPKGWAWASLDMISNIGSGISISRNRVVADPIELPYLRVANVLRGRLDLRDVKTMVVEQEKIESRLLHPGDVLFTEGGDRDKLGRGWIWEGQIPRCLHQNHIFRARLVDREAVQSAFVSYWGNTFGQRFFLKHGKQTTNLASINRRVLAMLPVPLPPTDEQKAILVELGKRLNAANRLKEKVQTQVDRSQVARETVLEDAFAGRLIPQELTDEPAVNLLKQIRVEQEHAKQRSERKPMTDSVTKSDKRTRRPLLTTLQEHGKSMTPEDLFRASGHSQESVDLFFAELRELTEQPAKIVEERDASGLSLLKALP
jgi:type I restriction enzyme S subunit